MAVVVAQGDRVDQVIVHLADHSAPAADPTAPACAAALRAADPMIVPGAPEVAPEVVAAQDPEDPPVQRAVQVRPAQVPEVVPGAGAGAVPRPDLHPRHPRTHRAEFTLTADSAWARHRAQAQRRNLLLRIAAASGNHIMVIIG